MGPRSWFLQQQNQGGNQIFSGKSLHPFCFLLFHPPTFSGICFIKFFYLSIVSLPRSHPAEGSFSYPTRSVLKKLRKRIKNLSPKYQPRKCHRASWSFSSLKKSSKKVFFLPDFFVEAVVKVSPLGARSVQKNQNFSLLFKTCSEATHQNTPIHKLVREQLFKDGEWNCTKDPEITSFNMLKYFM